MRVRPRFPAEPVQAARGDGPHNRVRVAQEADEGVHRHRVAEMTEGFRRRRPRQRHRGAQQFDQRLRRPPAPRPPPRPVRRSVFPARPAGISGCRCATADRSTKASSYEKPGGLDRILILNCDKSVKSAGRLRAQTDFTGKITLIRPVPKTPQNYHRLTRRFRLENRRVFPLLRFSLRVRDRARVQRPAKAERNPLAPAGILVHAKHMIAASTSTGMVVFEILIFVVVGVSVIVVGINQSRARRQRALDLRDLASRLGFEDFNPNRDDAFTRGWSFLSRLSQGDERYALNVLRGTYHEQKLFVYDYHYQTGSGKNTKQHDLTILMLVFKTDRKS